MIRPLVFIMAARSLRAANTLPFDRYGDGYNQALVDLTADLLSIDKAMAEDLILGEGTFA